jgi:response regulator RpfG family c-di-GMP phosphodiesterase
MSKLDVNKLVLGKAYEHNLGLDENILFLTPDLPLEEDDIQILNLWKIRQVELLDKKSTDVEQSTADTFEHYEVEKELYQKALDNVNGEIVRFFADMKTRGAGRFKPVADLSSEIISIVRRNKNLLLVLINMRLGQSITMSEMALFTAVYALVIGVHAKMDDAKLKFLFECAILINLAMLRREFESVLTKAGALTPADLQLIRSHPVVGGVLVRDKLKLPTPYATVVETHSEYLDGTGYPKGLSGDQIPIYSKILGACEEFIALCEEKPYRKRMSLQAAMRTLVNDGRKKFDQRILQMLLSNLSIYPLGSVVELNDGQYGVVVQANSNVPMRPIVRVLADSFLKTLENKKNIDLLLEKGVSIKRTIEEDIEREQIYQKL